MSRKLKVIEISKEKKEDEIWQFFNSALNFKAAFDILEPKIIIMQVRLVLGQYYIERLLKGFVIWKENKLYYEHSLVFLMQKISELNDMASNLKNALKITDA